MKGPENFVCSSEYRLWYPGPMVEIASVASEHFDENLLPIWQFLDMRNGPPPPSECHPLLSRTRCAGWPRIAPRSRGVTSPSVSSL